MSIVTDLIDEQQGIAQGMIHWRRYWRDVALYVLPQTEDYDRLLSAAPATAINAVATTPVAHDKSKHIYDMTSIWAVERLTAGLISLKTPETTYWHDLDTDDLFGEELNQTEMQGLEKVRNFLFNARSNPDSGFWVAHRAAMRSMCAFGDGWLFTEEVFGFKVPWRYIYIPLPQLYPAVDHTGRPNMAYRSFRMTAHQIASKWGEDKVGRKVADYANDPKRKNELFVVLHGVRPRSDNRRLRDGTLGGAFESHYVLAEEKHHIGEGGFFEFPYQRYAWSASGERAFSEGPIAYALGEVKSLNEMSKNELIASQAAIRPALGTFSKNMGRINFNPGATNAGLVNGEGKPLFAPLNPGSRPDFANLVIEARRNAVRETMYLNLWQILIEQPEQTATEAMIRAQEKGELLGPVGISLSGGLATLVDREISIMGRRGAFDEGSPLALPESLADRDVAPRWTSPLDRLRQMSELIGMQRLAAFAGELATLLGKPSVAQRLDDKVMIERAREILGAPVESLRDEAEVEQAENQANMMNQLAAMLQAAQGGGEAMKSVGEGAAALAGGTQAAANTPAPAPAAVPSALA